MRTAVEILRDVDQGIETFQLIEALKERLAGIEQRLAEDGLDRPEDHMPLIDSKREGRQFIAEGTGTGVPIVFTADKILQSAPVESVKLEIAQQIAGDLFSRFYAERRTHVTTTRDGAAFRELAAQLLGRRGPAFISACLDRDRQGLPKNDTKVEWKRGIANANIIVKQAA